MTTSEQIITLVRKYCLDLYDAGLSTQQRIAVGLLNGVEYLTGKQYEDYEILKTDIIKAAIKNLEEFTSAYSKKGHLQKIETEKQNFIQFVSQININKIGNLKPLPYKRRLTESESERIKRNLKEKWDFDAWCSGKYYWEPLVETNVNHIVFFDLEFLNQNDFHKIAQLLFSVEYQNIYFLTEDKVNYEIEPSKFDINFLESVYTDKNSEWIIYISHEGTIAFGGQELIDQIGKVLADKVNLKNKWR